MWKVVEAAMESSQLGELREGRLQKRNGSKQKTDRQAGMVGRTESAQSKKESTKNDKKAERTKHKGWDAVADAGGIDIMDDEDETGAGFFE